MHTDGHGLTLTNTDEISGARVLVVGLGRSGRAAARFLLKAGAKVAGFDENPATLISKPVAELRSAGMVIMGRGERREARGDWQFAVVSPGISDAHPLVRTLRRRSVPVLDELDLASRFVRGPVIAVTGTNGKSTTTALIALMLRNAGKTVFCGGNLAPGQPFSVALLTGRRDYYVVEASSFQLERARWLKPKIAVILNITPDHLNRHRTVQRYAECKFGILDRQGSDDHAVLNQDDVLVRAAEGRGDAVKHFFSLRRRTADSYLSAGCLWSGGRKVLPASQLRLPGTHNIQNCLAAITAVRLLGVGMLPIRRALRMFAGLPHRLEFVRRFRGVDYINSSMTTNPAAGARSLEAVSAGRRTKNEERGTKAGVILIAGGREKALPTDEYVRAMRKHATWVLLTGESSTRLARELTALEFHRYDVLPDLRAAVVTAREKAKPGDAVLFAPGFASFDQFKDFEARGEAFRKEVSNLG
jgi:UDP-N-acetylmuramoylalanine--D-glutamate ligase